MAKVSGGTASIRRIFTRKITRPESYNWEWDATKGSSTPDAAYMEKFFKRTQQLWDDYHPDQIYFDDTVLPFHGVTDEIGLNLAAHFYNTRLDKHGRTEAVMNGKWLNETQRRAMVYDIERGKAQDILPQPWQTDTCIGSWHYDRGHFQTSLLQVRRVRRADARGHRQQERQSHVERAAPARRPAGRG